MNKKFFLSFFSALAITIILVIPGCQNQATNPPESINNIITLDKPTSESTGPKFVEGELLVKFKVGIAQEKRNNAFNKISGVVVERILTNAMKRFGDNEGWYLVKSPRATNDAINSLKQFSDVESAEPNFIYYHFGNSNDPYYTNGSLWGMYGDLTSPRNIYGSNAGEKYPTSSGTTVYVGVIDEGVMYNHADLIGQVGNPNETANGIDDDNNGYVDDVYGWDFDGNDNSTYDGTQDDHGTHVSGTIAAKGNNGIGVAGVCWNVKIINAKFLGRRGGTTANAIKAVDYITDLKVNHGVNIIATNNSWGGGGYSSGLYDAIQRANNAGILFIAAAGNSSVNIDVSPSYPASYTNSNIISVASITSTGGLSSFSNYGSSSVDIGAPGSGIYSTLPGSKNTSTYGSYSGTSMATPHVTGAAALYYLNHPGSTAAQIKNAILSNAALTSSLTGKCSSGGRLDVSSF